MKRTILAASACLCAVLTFASSRLFAYQNVASVTPSRFESGVSVGTTIRVSFESAMKPLTFNDTTGFIVTGSVSGRHRGTIVLSFSDTVATFTPDVAFAAGEIVVVQLTSVLLLLTDEPLTPFGWTFTTEVAVSPGTFTGRVDKPTGDFAFGVSASDLDTDGDCDLVVANANGQTISVLKNNGDGTFADKTDYAAGDSPYAVFVSDLDGDGDGDIALPNYGVDSVSIFKNNGDGTFAEKVNYSTGSSPSALFVGDLDGDGDGDLAVVNRNASSVSILKNNGNGTFAAKVDYATGTTPFAIFIGDVDADGDGDLAVANYASDSVSILKNNGDGTFASKVNYVAGDSPYAIFLADLDGDGDGDLAVANYASDNVSILSNNGDGTFADSVNYGASDGPVSIYVVDLDGDADPDIAVSNFSSSTVSVLKNNGNGTFGAKTDFNAGSSPYAMTAGDLDGDDDCDIAVTRISYGGVSLLPATGGNVLPVQLVTCSASMRGSAVELQWTTMTEVDNAGWEIERSYSGSQSIVDSRQTEAGGWVKIGFVDGAGTSTSPKNYQFTDPNPFSILPRSTNLPGRGLHFPFSISYRLKQIDRSGSFSYSEAIKVDRTSAPGVFFLSQNFPNPFNPSTTIDFTLPEDGHAALKIFNMIGQEVATLVDEDLKAGIVQRVTFDAGYLSGGIYFARLQFGGQSILRRMLLLK